MTFLSPNARHMSLDDLAPKHMTVLSYVSTGEVF
jgi:hypothetical protein